MKTFKCDIGHGKEQQYKFEQIVRTYIKEFDHLTIRMAVYSPTILEVFDKCKEPIILIDLSLPIELQMYQLGQQINKLF